MIISMPDSVNVGALPDGYSAYLGYVDGDLVKPTMPALRARFPRARLIGLTTTGETFTGADGCDIETGDLTPDDGARWARRKLGRDPGSRPVLYASVSRIGAVRDRMVVHQVPRESVRLLSAHWGEGEHICGPGTCRQVSIGMDGTQWTDNFQGTGVDMSALQAGFFGSWTEEIVRELPVVRQGDSGEAVRTVQGCLQARGYQGVAIDGMFGGVTKSAVSILQGVAHIAQDGIVGPLTWPVLLGIA